MPAKIKVKGRRNRQGDSSNNNAGLSPAKGERRGRNGLRLQCSSENVSAQEKGDKAKITHQRNLKLAEMVWI